VRVKSLKTNSQVDITEVTEHVSYCIVRNESLAGLSHCTGDLARLQERTMSARWRTMFDPQLLPHQQSAKLDGLVLADTKAPPEYSISYPVHDHGSLLDETLMSVFMTTCGSYEVVITLDNCVDDSKTHVWNTIARYLEFQRNASHLRKAMDSEDLTTPCTGLLTRVVVLETVTDLFETAADNLAMSITSPSGYYILVQADLRVYQSGWNVHMSFPARSDKNVLGVSGRCGHSFPECGGAKTKYAAGNCRSDRRTPKPDLWSKRFLFFETDLVVRSPLLLRASYMQQLQFFDQIHYKLGNDDWDLCKRGWVAGWRVGVQVIDVRDRRNENNKLAGRIRARTSSEKEILEHLNDEWKSRNESTPMLAASNAQKSPDDCHNRITSWAADDADIDRMIAGEVMRDIGLHASF